MKNSFKVLLAVLISAAALRAQVAAPNEAGVSMGHLYLNVRDMEANKNFWTALGGTFVVHGPSQIVKFPDVLVFIRQQDPTGGSVGSVVNHIGFKVPDVPAAVAKWKAAGLDPMPGRTPNVYFLASPDNVRIEIQQDPSVSVPIVNHHIHFNVAESSIPDMQAWYAKTFGAKPGMRAGDAAADIPGANLTFSKSAIPVAPTTGRALDHIGFEVKNLDAFCKKLAAGGIKFDRPYTKRDDAGLSSAFISDPWGTSIELTEGLDGY